MADNDIPASGEELWRPSTPKSTPMWEFLENVNKKRDINLQSWQELYQWSVDNIAAFWEDIWHFCGIRASKPYDQVVDETAPMYPRPAFFSGALLNFAENLLFPTQPVDEASPALIATTETDRETVSWKELRERVAICQAGLKAVGLKQGDRVAGYLGNHANAIVAMLATTSLGGIWTAVSPDSGVVMVLDRMKQIEPVVIFSDNAQAYNGKTFGVLDKLADIVKELPTLQTVVVFPAIASKSMDLSIIKAPNAKVYDYSSFTSLAKGSPELTFAQLPPDTPVYILYSSGTTGAPKCIVHGAIGTLIQHKKEHVLHCSIVPGARVFYFTTCTWMMWHWLVSGLAAGATLVLYDGSPMRYRQNSGSDSDAWESVADDMAMARLIDEMKIQHFGTSAKYLSVLEQKDVFPKEHGIKLESLQAIYNTASPLAPSTFRYVYKAFGPDIMLGSITGGTDIISLFGASNPILPVHAGEVQSPGLGMSIRSFDSEGPERYDPASTTTSGLDISHTNTPGDLVCTRAFPSQPLYFYNDTSSTPSKYASSYFTRYRANGVLGSTWHHGDFILINPTTGGLLMLGRSDGVLNPAGVRFGSAEIYALLLRFFAADVADSVCVGWKREGWSDELVVLFVKMADGHHLTEALAKDIKGVVRRELSARHVPARIEACLDVPVTVNGKKVESAVKKIISGSKVKSSASVANGESLEFFEEWAARNNV